MNWYATNLDIFHKAASCTPPNYGLMEHMIVSTLVRLDFFTVKRSNVGFIKYILTNGTKYSIRIKSYVNESDNKLRTITVELCELIDDVDTIVSVRTNTLLGEHALLDLVVNMVISKILPKSSQLLYE